MASPDLVSIVVRDMGASLKFYRLLGLDIPEGLESEPHAEIAIEGGFRIAWDTVDVIETIHGEWIEPSGHRMALAFDCESPEKVDALYKRVIEAGYPGRKDPWDAFWGQRYAIVEDPDGNLVDLFAGMD